MKETCSACYLIRPKTCPSCTREVANSDSSSGWEDDEQRDERGPAVVVRGGVIGGFKFYGPFDSIEDAVEWCETKTLMGAVYGASNDSIVLLEQPKQDGTVV